MKTLLFAILTAALVAGSTGCCCMGGGCSPCASYGGGCNSCGPTYGYAPAYGGCNSCGPAVGGCPNGNCGVGGPVYSAPGVFPQGSYYGPTDVMQASTTPMMSPVASSVPYTQTTMSPNFMQTAMAPSYPQTAMAPLQSLPTY